ncbi:conserved hypothetical protein [Musicola paradisiaca Ech703]|uniref:Uncharacterized protein n=2 Tax=Musicola paradisiaca TaxID=69223 RepID=C6CA55_MUSP7|nr:conserved hypothetical protein [Musicola paradisiaca Ech703]
MSVKNISIGMVLFVFSSMTLAAGPTPQQCQQAFRLGGNTDVNFKDVTPNNWNSQYLPAIWVDNGGHFLSRIKESARGGAAGIYTPSDLESFVRSGSVIKGGQTDRWMINKIEVKSYSVIFDINPSSKKCELVTFLIADNK